MLNVIPKMTVEGCNVKGRGRKALDRPPRGGTTCYHQYTCSCLCSYSSGRVFPKYVQYIEELKRRFREKQFLFQWSGTHVGRATE